MSIITDGMPPERIEELALVLVNSLQGASVKTGAPFRDTDDGTAATFRGGEPDFGARLLTKTEAAADYIHESALRGEPVDLAERERIIYELVEDVKRAATVGLHAESGGAKNPVLEPELPVQRALLPGAEQGEQAKAETGAEGELFSFYRLREGSGQRELQLREKQVSAPAADLHLELLDADRVSRYFDRDSRRYDSAFERF